MTNAPAGWYPDASAPGRQRWWDGNAWTDTYAPGVASPTEAPKPRWMPPAWLRIVGALVVAGVVALIVWGILSAIGSSGRGPEAAVRAYNTAWWQSDCVAFEATTTDALRAGFRDDAGLGYSCATFEAQADTYYAGSSGMAFRIISTEVTGSSATIKASETGTDSAGGWKNDWVYDLELVDGAWLVDSETFVEPPG